MIGNSKLNISNEFKNSVHADEGYGRSAIPRCDRVHRVFGWGGVSKYTVHELYIYMSCAADLAYIEQIFGKLIEVINSFYEIRVGR